MQDTYFQYLQDKFHWTTSPTDSIQWQVLQLVLQCFNHNKCKTLTKFIHEWLPLQDQYQVHSASSNHLCPSCHSAPETVIHFISCPHPERQALWKELDDQLQKYFLHHQINLTYHDIFQHGLLQGWNAPSRFDLRPTLMEPLQNLYKAQSSLGWQQLYYGCLSPMWVTLHNMSHLDINSLHYYTKCVTFI